MGVMASLSIQFGECAATIHCHDQAVYNVLRHHLRYCQGEGTVQISSYTLQANLERWQLWRDNDLLHEASDFDFLLEPLVQDLLMQLITPVQEYLVFHAGGVALADDGMMLCGQSGQGKSTLSAVLLSEDFDYLTDEVVAMPLMSTQMKGFARSLVLRDGSTFAWENRLSDNGFDHLQQLCCSKVWVAPDDLRPDSVREQATLRLLIFPHFTAGKDFVVRPLSPAEASFQLMQHLVNAKNLPAHGLTAVTALAKQVDAYTVQYSDATAVADWLHKRLTAK